MTELTEKILTSPYAKYINFPIEVTTEIELPEVKLTEEEILADELAEKVWYEKQKEMNSSLLPCPKCGSKVYISFCEWYCCEASALNIECLPCRIYSSPNIEEWNDRVAKLYDFETGVEIKLN